MARQNGFYKGQFYGLPSKLKHVPFSSESRTKEVTGLTDSQLQVVVAVVAAEFVQLGPVSLRQINTVVSCEAGSRLHGLVVGGWLEVAAKAKGTTGKLYVPTSKAWRELGLNGWSLLKEVA